MTSGPPQPPATVTPVRASGWTIAAIIAPVIGWFGELFAYLGPMAAVVAVAIAVIAVKREPRRGWRAAALVAGFVSAAVLAVQVVLIVAVRMSPNWVW